MAFSIPPSLRDTSPIAHSCAEEEVNTFGRLLPFAPVSIFNRNRGEPEETTVSSVRGWNIQGQSPLIID